LHLKCWNFYSMKVTKLWKLVTAAAIGYRYILVWYYIIVIS